MDIEPQTVLAIAAVGALAYTCLSKKEEPKPIIPIVGGTKSRRKSAKKSCNSMKRKSCITSTRCSWNRNKKGTRKHKPYCSKKKSKRKSIRKSARKSTRNTQARAVRKSTRNTQARAVRKSTSRMTVGQLRKKLDEQGKSIFGSKQELIDRLYGKKTSSSSQSRGISSSKPVEKMTVPHMKSVLLKKGKSESGDRTELENRLRSLL